MTRARKILEAFAKGFNKSVMGGRKEYIEIFVNPTHKELMNASGPYGVRFFADPKKKKVYAWNAEYIHLSVMPEIGYSYKDSNLLLGTANLKNGKWIMTTSDRMAAHPQMSPETLKGIWGWVDKYILTTPFLGSVRSGEWKPPEKRRMNVAAFR